jgi:hypothetical protein
MMIDISRLRQSAFDATTDDSAWRAGLNLWFSAWHSVPAGSLDNDDGALAKGAGLGRDLKSWRKVKATVLRGWIECDDGRLYHPVVSELALESWIEKLQQRLSSGEGNAKRWGVDFDAAPIREAMEAAAGRLRSLNPQSRTLAKLQRRGPKPPKRPEETIPPGDIDFTGVINPGHPDEIPPGRRQDIPSGSQETGTGEGTGIQVGGGGARANSPAADWPEGDGKRLTALLIEASRTPWLDPTKSPELTLTLGRLAAWKREGASWEHDVVPVVTALCAKRREPISSWKFFDKAIARSIADNRAALEIPEARGTGPPGAHPLASFPPSSDRRHERPSAPAKQQSTLDNYGRAFAGSERASGSRGKP